MIGKQVWSLTPAKIILGGFFLIIITGALSLIHIWLPLDPILYPGTEATDELLRLFSQCDDKQLAVITAMTETMIDINF